jgi:ABC-2 type transport system permease protein
MTSIRRTLCFVRVVMRQLFNDRASLFFFVVLPIVVIVVIGSTFGNSGGGLSIAVVGAEGSATRGAIEASIDSADGVTVETFDDVEQAAQQVRRQALAAVVILPDELDRRVLDGSADIVVMAEPGSATQLVATDVARAAVSAATGVADAARFVAATAAVPLDAAVEAATGLEPSVADTKVLVVDVGTPSRSELSQFSLTAPQNLVLFVFINSLAGAASLVSMRRRGVLRRVLAGPTSTAQVIVGLAAAWFTLALFQSAVVLGVGRVAFGVDWGDPVAATALTAAFALVGAGAGLLVGAVFDDPDRVAAAGPPIGVLLGALGGCMVPLEVFPASMESIARATPHYWAMTAWQRLIFDGDGLGAITVHLTVLLGVATALLVLAALRLRRSIAV